MDKKTKRRELWYKIALCTAGYGMMSDNVISPMVRAISSEFSTASEFMLNMVISGTGMFALVTGLLTGFLMKKIPKRKILIAGTIMFTVGGVLGSFSPSMEFLAFTRLIDSASDGVLTAVTATIIVEHWRSEKEQAQMFSLYNMMSNVFGIIMSLAAGYLTVFNWRYAFATHIVTIISPILCILFVYDDMANLDTTLDGKVAEKHEVDEVQAYKASFKFPIFLIIAMFFAFCFVEASAYMPTFLIDLVVEEKAFGNSVVSGWLGTALTLSGLVSYSFSSVVETKMGMKKFGIATFAGLGVSLLMYGLLDNIVLIAIAQFLNGFFGSWLFLLYQMLIAKLAVNRSQGIMMSLCTSSVYVNGFIAPYFPSLLKGIGFSGKVCQSSTVLGVIAFVFMIGYILLYAYMDRFADAHGGIVEAASVE